MHFFEYPYVIITILVMLFILMGLIGLYFTMKSVLTSKGTAGKGFSSLNKLEAEFERAGAERKNRCIVYISMPLDTMQRTYSEPKVNRMYEHVKRILFRHFCLTIGGELSIYGSENFVALNDLSAERIEQYIEICSKEIKDALMQHGAVGIVHIHFGYLVTAATDVSFQTILARAKQACSMAENKEELFCRWDPSNGKDFERKLSIENSIQTEIENNRFFLEFQPILNAKTNQIMGAEVLSRLNSPTEGILTPRIFLSAVNNVGLNRQFDYYIFEKNCKWISGDKERRMNYVYTINFSRFTLCDPDLAQNIISIIESYGIDYSCIAIEILEDKNLDSDEKASMVQNLTALKEKGILILLDDFGKGHTTFNDLTEFSIDIVKIDKSITQNAETKTGFVILKNIIQTAHDLGFKTLCEGIETESQQKTVTDAGCDILQGYYLYRPMPVTKFETLFDQ